MTLPMPRTPRHYVVCYHVPSSSSNTARSLHTGIWYTHHEGTNCRPASAPPDTSFLSLPSLDPSVDVAAERRERRGMATGSVLPHPACLLSCGSVAGPFVAGPPVPTSRGGWLHMHGEAIMCTKRCDHAEPPWKIRHVPWLRGQGPFVKGAEIIGRISHALCTTTTRPGQSVTTASGTPQCAWFVLLAVSALVYSGGISQK